ncbi:MAG: DUF2752 domain-containing protein [Flavobacteriaceae bacterium]|nr:DUF2752 domain-containing protein [Flavobacteriaceae bacterium]
MSLVSFLEKYLFSCQWKKHLNIECLGCGFQRSIIHLLKGEFIDAFYVFPAIYTLILMFTILILHLKFNFKKGGRILLFVFILNILVMLTNYILKLY